MFKSWKVISKPVLACSLIAGSLIVPATYPLAAAATEVKSVTYVLPSLNYQNLKISLKDINLMPSSNGKVVSFTATYYNSGNSSIDMTDYWVRLKTKSGTQYSIKTLATDSSKITVAPKSSQTVTYYSAVGSQVELQDLTIQWIQFDFSTSGYERTIGKFTFPMYFTNTVKAGSQKTIQVADTDLRTKITESSISNSEESYTVNLTWQIENIGKQSIPSPSLKYYLQTSEGYLYPFEISTDDQSDSTQLSPLATQEINLSATVPASVKQKYWKLVVAQETGDATKVTLPISSYEIPKELANAGASTGTNEFNYTNTNGTYQVQLGTVQRLSWDADDILGVDLNVLNKGKNSATPLDLSAQLILDDKVTIDATVIKPASTTAIQTGGQQTVHVYAKIPYDLKYSKAQIVIKENVSGSSTKKTLNRFTFTSSNEALSVLGPTEKLSVQENGRKSELAIHDVRTYSNDSGKITAVQFDETNKENRYNQPAIYSGYFLNKDGSIIPANATQTPTKLTANAKNTVVFWAPLKGDVKDWTLIVGQSVVNDKYAAGSEDVSTGLVNAVKYVLPEENAAGSKAIGVDLHPYNLDIEEFTPYPYENTLTLTMKYKLTKDAAYEASAKGKKLIMELEDSEGNVPYSQTLDLEKADTSESLLTLGENTIVLKKNYDNIEQSIVTLRPFTLKLYEEFQGQRKLLTSQPFWWYTTNRFGQD